MTEPLLPYDLWIDGALRGVIRRAISHAAEHGLPGNHHYYITFRTTAEGVGLAEWLRLQHPEQMTIVLQHQYRGLEVGDEGFSVSLRFKGRSERLYVPFASIVAFADPAVNFGLQFKIAGAPAGAAEAEAAAAVGDAGERAADGGDVGADARGEVITLDTFRKK